MCRNTRVALPAGKVFLSQNLLPELRTDNTVRKRAGLLVSLLRMKQENGKFQASQGYMARSCVQKKNERKVKGNKMSLTNMTPME
jgi:hypothetical protein